MTNPLFRFIDWAGRTPWMMTLVILACLGVGGWGFYDYYGAQFAWIGLQHWYVYPFVPDCPLFVYFFAIVMIGRYLHIEHPAFTAFTAIGNIKYGVWTVFVLLYYYDRFFSGPDAGLRSLILLLHVGMVPLGILLWRTAPRPSTSHYLAIGGVLLLYDYMDYFFTNAYQVYPIGLPNHGVYHPFTPTELGLVPWFTLAETLLLTAWMAVSKTRYETRERLRPEPSPASTADRPRP